MHHNKALYYADSKDVSQWGTWHAVMQMYHNKALYYTVSITWLFAYCKGGNFNIHIWAWFGYFIC